MALHSQALKTSTDEETAPCLELTSSSVALWSLNTESFIYIQPEAPKS